MKGEKLARFSIGQRVLHRMFDYRGVIFNVDAEFEGDEEWYQQVAQSRPPKNRLGIMFYLMAKSILLTLLNETWSAMIHR